MFNQNTTSYTRAFSYENFMRRAFQQGRDNSKGIDSSVFELLDHITKGYYGTKKDYPKQMAKVKNYLSKGIARVLLWDLNANERNCVLNQAQIIRQTNDEITIYHALNELLEATQRLIDN